MKEPKDIPESQRVAALICLFNKLFLEQENTSLEAGTSEPLYLPAENGRPARVIFAHGYFQSALHEISHWCIAGAKRRALVDFGYWYEPDGRSAEQQAEFEQVEVKPQALEWILSEAANARFHLSADNIANGGGEISRSFAQAVHQQAKHYLEHGLPPRAKILFDALISEFRENLALHQTVFSHERLGIYD